MQLERGRWCHHVPVAAARGSAAIVVATICSLPLGLAAGATASPVGTAQTWKLQNIPSPEDNSVLDGVSCPTATRCVAVGYEYQQEGGIPKELVETWSPQGWSTTPVPQPPRYRLGTYLTSVSCASAESCVAVGTTGSAEVGDEYPFSLVRAAGSWRVVTTATVLAGPSGGDVDLVSVSCATRDNCDAVGSFTPNGGGTTGTLAESWDGTAWSLVKTAAFPHGGRFTSISCLPQTVPALCDAVGARGTRSGLAPLDELANATTYTPVTVPVVRGAQSAFLTSVSCPGPNSCLAVGAVEVPTDFKYLSFTEVENGGVSPYPWALVSDAAPGRLGRYFDASSVSCPLVIAQCAAVGVAATTTPEAQAEMLNAPSADLDAPFPSVKWQVSPLRWSSPGGAPSPSIFAAVSCSGPTACTAVGNFQAEGIGLQVIAARL